MRAHAYARSIEFDEGAERSEARRAVHMHSPTDVHSMHSLRGALCVHAFISALSVCHRCRELPILHNHCSDHRNYSGACPCPCPCPACPCPCPYAHMPTCPCAPCTACQCPCPWNGILLYRDFYRDTHRQGGRRVPCSQSISLEAHCCVWIECGRGASPASQRHPPRAESCRA